VPRSPHIFEIKPVFSVRLSQSKMLSSSIRSASRKAGVRTMATGKDVRFGAEVRLARARAVLFAPPFRAIAHAKRDSRTP
jgi:hypothetical protein